MAQGTVSIDRLNLRESPDANGATIGTLLKNTPIDVISERRVGDVTWLLVASEIDGQTSVGWIQSNFTDLGREAETGSGGTSEPLDTGDLQAKPGNNRNVVNMLLAGAKKHGLDQMMILTVVKIESNFNPMAKNPNSTAGGLFQFLDSTWVGEGGARFPGGGGNGNGHAARASIETQIEMGCKFILKIIKFLKDKQINPIGTTEIYMAHQQGNGGALKILAANPNTPIESVIGVSAARLNGFGGMTVAETINKFRNLVRVKGDLARGETMPATPAIAGAGTTQPGSDGDVAQKITEMALTEMERFARKNGFPVKEKDEPLHSRVLEYFRFVNFRGNPTEEPWSAAFISFVMHKGGGITNEKFPKSVGHAKYILESLRNRIANRFDASIVYFDKNEKAPRVGDLIGFSRTSAVKNRADIEAFLSKPVSEQFFPAHTDLVVDVRDREISVIGGNMSDTIDATAVKLDAEGRIDPLDKHFFIMRVNI